MKTVSSILFDNVEAHKLHYFRGIADVLEMLSSLMLISRGSFEKKLHGEMIHGLEYHVQRQKNRDRQMYSWCICYQMLEPDRAGFTHTSHFQHTPSRRVAIFGLFDFDDSHDLSPDEMEILIKTSTSYFMHYSLL